MKPKKIRGHRRRWATIHDWSRAYSTMDLNEQLVNRRERFYAKINIHPWNGLSLTSSAIVPTRGLTKQMMVGGLLDIYESWKQQLDVLGQEYYLKIWLFEPRFLQSQVVCAVGDCKNFYENTFFQAETTRIFDKNRYGELQNRLQNFRWEHRLDEDFYDKSDVGEAEDYATQADYQETKKWFDKLLTKPHRTLKFTEAIDDITESYAFKRGDVWLGEWK